MSLKVRIMLGAIAASSMLAMSAAYAANASAIVQLGDLNLDRPADVAAMYERINSAAEQVCRQRALNGAYVISPRYEHCVTDTVEKVVASINRAPLTSFSRQRTPVRVASAAQP
jgi:UrcA family protein